MSAVLRTGAAAAVLAATGGALAAQPAPGPFPDAPRGHWAYTAVESLRQRGILLGYPDGPARKQGGVNGTAVVGPVRPVDRPGQPNTRPLAGAILTFEPEKGGTEVARAKADAQGRFRVKLAPGAYRLVPLPPTPGSRYPRGAPQTVTVTAGAFTHVTVEYDSGIR